MSRAFGLRYDPVEDRLEAEVEAPDEARYRLHLTRRVCAHLAERFDQLAQASAQVPESADPSVRKAIASSHHDAFAAQVTLGRTERAAHDPQARTGAHLALVTGIRCGRRRTDQKWVLEFHYRTRSAPAPVATPGAAATSGVAVPGPAVPGAAVPGPAAAPAEPAAAGSRESVALVLSQTALHGVIELFRKTLGQTGWNLALLNAPSAPIAAAAARSMH